MLKNLKFCDTGECGEEMPIATPQILVEGYPLDICDKCADVVTVTALRIIAATKKSEAEKPGVGP
jgi:ribosome-binding protein aMBF1 (putative translation factor)